MFVSRHACGKANQSGPQTLSASSGGKKSRPVDWHGNKLCSNMTQKRGKRASAPERVEYEFRSGARISQGLPRRGHGTAGMSKAMPSATATAAAARRTFQWTVIARSHHRVAETTGDLCESEPRAFSSERTASLSIHSSLLLAGGPSDSFPGTRGFGRRSFSMIWATCSVLTWTGRRAKNTSISERRSWVCFLAIGGPTLGDHPKPAIEEPPKTGQR